MSATGRSAAAETGHVRHADDFYSTPEWCTRAILPHLPRGPVLDPCAGSGAIINVVQKEWKTNVYGLEIDRDRSNVSGTICCDAIDPRNFWEGANVITNPPYSLAMPFVLRALLECTSRGFFAAFLLRVNWVASQRRSAFHRANPSDLYILPKRPSFTPDGKTDATEYAWFVWGPGRGGRWQVLEIDP